MAALRVVGLGGSIDGSSATWHALSAALRAAQVAGAEVEAFDLAELDLPMYRHGAPVPEVAQRWVAAVQQADALIWSAPLYHGSVSGAFKNAIDYLELLRLSEPAYLSDKLVGLICCAGGVQGMQALNHMENMVRSLRGLTCPLVVPVARAWQAFGAGGEPTQPEVAQQLDQLGREVVRLARRQQVAAADRGEGPA